MEVERIRAAGDLGAVAPPVPIGVRIDRTGAVDVGLVMVTQAVPVLIPGCSPVAAGAAVGHERIGAVEVDLVPIQESVEVRVRMERAGAVGVDLVAVRDAVEVGVGVLQVGAVEGVLLVIGETITVVVARATTGGRRR